MVEEFFSVLPGALVAILTYTITNPAPPAKHFDNNIFGSSIVSDKILKIHFYFLNTS